MSNVQEVTYAKELVPHLRTIADAQEAIKELMGSAKDAGLNAKAIRKAASEMIMDSDKREKRYEDERQLDWLRDQLNLTGGLRMAAE